MHIKKIETEKKQDTRRFSLLSAIAAGTSDLFSLFESNSDWEKRRKERLEQLNKRLSLSDSDRDLSSLDEITDFRNRKKLGPRAKKFEALGIESGPEQDLISLRGDFEKAVSKFEKEYI